MTCRQPINQAERRVRSPVFVSQWTRASGHELVEIGAWLTDHALAGEELQMFFAAMADGSIYTSVEAGHPDEWAVRLFDPGHDPWQHIGAALEGIVQRLASAPSKQEGE